MSPPDPQRRSRLPLRLGAALLFAATAVQLYTAVGSDRRFLARLPARWVTERQDPFDPTHAAVRVLPQLAARVPPQARVLLVTSVLDRIPYQMYFLPRQYEQLQVFPESWLATIEERDVYWGWHARQVRERLAAARRLWSPQRLAELLPATDYVVTFLFEDPALAPPVLRPVAEIEGIRLFVVER